jgi:acetyltransferase
MSVYRLRELFSARSVAIIGASPRSDSLGRAVLANMRAAKFEGTIGLVNPRHKEIDGLPCVATLDELPTTPDLVVIATPAATVPSLVASAARMGVTAAIILSAGLEYGPGSLAEETERAARAHGLRLIGPNCLGLLVPSLRLNASFASAMPPAGDLAIISQSGAIAAAMVEWGIQRAIGFSTIVSVGDQLDVDLGDLLDYFALDRATRAILVYIESIKDARKFMSAARAAARAKPVVVVKAGRHSEGARAAATHTGALAGSDAVYDAAFRRAGLLRVEDLSELFDAAGTLALVRHLKGYRLAILTNGGGVGVLAIDRLADLGGTPAAISPDIMARLDSALPPMWSRANPVDIIGDATAGRYVAALEALLADPQNDAVLVLNVHTAMASSLDIARAVAAVVEKERTTHIDAKPVLSSWIGAAPRIVDIFSSARIPHYVTESEAVRGFMHLVRYRDTQRSLMETPPSLPEHFAPDDDMARQIARIALQEGRTWLDPLETARLLQAYAIPIVPVQHARDPDQAVKAAIPFLAEGGTVAIKVLSRDITHKSDVDGVRLNLRDTDSVRKAALEVIANAKHARPTARIDGVIVQPMLIRPKARELIAGIADDPTFGPVVVFGRGGTAVEVINDKALALPPLDLKLAEELIARTRVSRILKSYRNVPAVKPGEVALTLVKLAQLVADVPEIRELDINPLLADETGVIALDARIAVAPIEAKFGGQHHTRFAVRPYPKQWEREIKLADGQVARVRPVRPEDEPLFARFFPRVTAEDLRLRFFAPVKDFSHVFIARLTQIDYARSMAFIAVDPTTGELMGVVRLHADANYETGEYAILLRSDLKGRGLGWGLMQLMIQYARQEHLQRIYGEVLHDNTVMLRMCRELGFDVRNDPEDPNMSLVTLDLTKTVW